MSLRPLHIASHALPTEVGYTLRTHKLLQSQVGIGLSPSCIVRANGRLFPHDRIEPPAIGVRVIDGVPYCRLTEPRPLHRFVVRGSQWLQHKKVRGSWRFGAGLSVPEDEWRPFLEWSSGFDVVHAHSPFTCAEAGLRFATALGCPFVYEVRGFWELTAESAGRESVGEMRLDQWRERDTAAAIAADAVITLGRTMKSELVRRGVPDDRIHVVGNGVDTEMFRPRPKKDEQLAARLSIADSFVIGCATNVRRLEGLSLVLKALVEFRRHRPTVTFVLLGDGTDLQRLKAEARDLGVDHRVRFVGRVPHGEIPRFYSLFDAFVVPRVDEAVCRVVTPLKPLEAMAMAIPIIVSDVSALTELLDEGANGSSFRAGDHLDLASNIETMMKYPDERQALGTRAREWVCRERQWNALTQTIKSLYEKLLARSN